MIRRITRAYGELREKQKDHQKRIMDRTGLSCWDGLINKILARFSAYV